MASLHSRRRRKPADKLNRDNSKRIWCVLGGLLDYYTSFDPANHIYSCTYQMLQLLEIRLFYVLIVPTYSQVCDVRF